MLVGHIFGDHVETQVWIHFGELWTPKCLEACLGELSWYTGQADTSMPRVRVWIFINEMLRRSHNYYLVEPLAVVQTRRVVDRRMGRIWERREWNWSWLLHGATGTADLSLH